MFINQPIGIIL